MYELPFRITVWTIYTRSIFSRVLLKIFWNFRNTSRKKSTVRSSLSQAFYNKCHEKVRKIEKKTPMLESLFNKISRNKESSTQVFSCEFCEALKNTFFTEDLRWSCSLKNVLLQAFTKRFLMANSYLGGKTICTLLVSPFRFLHFFYFFY